MLVQSEDAFVKLKNEVDTWVDSIMPDDYPKGSTLTKYLVSADRLDREVGELRI